MVKIYIKRFIFDKNQSFFISCIKFHKIFMDSFNEISLIPQSVNNADSYWLEIWQTDFKENLNFIRKWILLYITPVNSDTAYQPTSVSVSFRT